MLLLEGEIQLLPIKEFLSASHTKRGSDEKFQLILQLPRHGTVESDISQAGVIDFENQKLIMCAFSSKGGRHTIYSCSYTDYPMIPWQSIENSLNGTHNDPPQDESTTLNADNICIPSIQITSPLSSSAPISLLRDKYNLIRLEMILKEKTWIHFKINGQEIGNIFYNL